jgi:hypothetical protein
VLENRALRRILRCKMDEVTGNWRRLHNEELNALYRSNAFRVIKPRRMRRAGHIERTGDRKAAYKVLVGKPEGKIPLERPKCRWVDTFKNV